ncbi:MAG: 50S ribosomal protein L10 [Verrucomicrobia bacterium GWF2_51_19]|nr:MAG: 50S ribosomal protein L10 [Verrucomicrobia bacterium GWF2_51_19]HCJ12564.1 50S ribosomal protein L10 [Opitutae bacterium]
MRQDKQFLVQEVASYLDASNYVILADFKGMTVADVAELRKALRAESATYHVVKNSIFNVVAKERSFPDMSNLLQGQNAVVVGGSNPSGVAKVLMQFAKDKKKLEMRGAILEKRLLSAGDVEALSKLPSLEVLRAQLLGLLNTPAQKVLYVLQGVPQGLLNVLNAHAEV